MSHSAKHCTQQNKKKLKTGESQWQNNMHNKEKNWKSVSHNDKILYTTKQRKKLKTDESHWYNIMHNRAKIKTQNWWVTVTKNYA